MMNANLQVEGMNCMSCVRKIENALRDSGIEGAVDFAQRTVDVTFDENRFDLAGVCLVIESKGYRVVR